MDATTDSVAITSVADAPNVLYALTREEALAAYRMMLLIRRFEEAVNEAFAQSRVRGTSHLCIGQEGVAVGAMAGLRPDDQVTSNHRGHGHFLAKGGHPKRIMAELFGKETGYAGGRGGTQHMAWYEIGFLGSNGVTGGGIPIATGAALAARQTGSDHIVVCFFGDGASAQGTFHESLNIAALWKLPVVYLCENNQYAMSTPVSESCPVPRIADRALGYGIPSESVDGSDVSAVKGAVLRAAERARAGDGPTLVEARTYRYHGHSKSDTCEYRTREEEARHKARDPILLAESCLLRAGWVDAPTLAAMRADVGAQVAEAVKFAEESPEPSGDATEGVFADE
jgi:TPP-dependent pyruvate/acetoin dehydrogenase alpha subunit